MAYVTEPDWDKYPDAEWFTPEDSENYATYYKAQKPGCWYWLCLPHCPKWNDQIPSVDEHLNASIENGLAVRNPKFEQHDKQDGENSWLDF